MAVVDYFLKIDGIQGESTDDKHKGEIEIDSFSFGVQNRTTIGSATGGAGAGKAKFNEFTIKKTTDSASPVLFKSCAAGQHLKKAVFSARKAGEQPVEFLKITLSDVLVSSYQISASVNPGPPMIVAAPVDAVFVAPSQGIVGPDVPSDAVSLNFASVQFTEGPVQHISVVPTGSGQLAFDPKTGLVSVVEAPADVMTVGSVNGGIQRGVQEFNIAILIGLLTAPFSTAHLRLAVSEIRESPINPGATIASVSANSDTEAPRPHLFDVILYTPADGVIDASDLTRPGKRVGTIAVDPNADPASLDLDLTSIVTQRDLDAFGIRIQLRGLDLPDSFNEPEDVHSDDDTEGDTSKTPFSASFSLDLALDTQ